MGAALDAALRAATGTGPPPSRNASVSKRVRRGASGVGASFAARRFGFARRGAGRWDARLGVALAADGVGADAAGVGAGAAGSYAGSSSTGAAGSRAGAGGGVRWTGLGFGAAFGAGAGAGSGLGAGGVGAGVTVTVGGASSARDEDGAARRPPASESAANAAKSGARRPARPTIHPAFILLSPAAAAGAGDVDRG